MMIDNLLFFFSIVLLACNSEGQDNGTTHPKEPTVIPVPYGGDVLPFNNLTQQDSLNFPYHDSNETHIDANERNITANFTAFLGPTTNCVNHMFRFSESEIEGFTYNSSLIYKYERRLIPSDEYYVGITVENNGTRIRRYFICVTLETGNEETDKAIINIYLPCLIISTICYFGSAIIYYFLLKVEDDHKKCFLGYSLSMGVTFLLLIGLQLVGTGCNILGSLFFLFIFASFVWSTCLCVDLNLSIRNFESRREVKRFYLYVSIACLYPCFMLIISLLITPSGSPDVPDSFIKYHIMMRPDKCRFIDTNFFMFFVPTGLLAFASVGSLGYSFYLIWRNEKLHKYHINWLEKRSQFKYMFSSCGLLMLMIVIWIADVLVRNSFNFVNIPYALDIIEATQGIFAVAIFVFNRYSRRKIRDAFRKEVKNNSSPVNYQDLIERFKDNEVPD